MQIVGVTFYSYYMSTMRNRQVDLDFVAAAAFRTAPGVAHPLYIADKRAWVHHKGFYTRVLRVL